MLGVRYIKSQPTVHLMQYRGGKVVRSGTGESFFYYSPVSTVVAIPVASNDAPFMLQLVTGDFQSVSVQGQVTWRINEPEKMSSLLDFSLDASGKHYASEDPLKLANRVVTQAEIVIQKFLQSRDLKQVLNAAAEIAVCTQATLSEQLELAALGISVQGVSVQAIKPTPDIARALEAEAREANLKSADDAVYARRIAAVENEQSIREKELDTDIAVQEKQKAIEEARLETRAVVIEKENLLRAEQLDADVSLEERKKALVSGEADNIRTRSEAEAFRMESLMAALQTADPKTIQALASVNMEPGQLIAQAFGGIADNAERIGQLNLSSELLHGLLSGPGKPVVESGSPPSARRRSSGPRSAKPGSANPGKGGKQ